MENSSSWSIHNTQIFIAPNPSRASLTNARNPDRNGNCAFPFCSIGESVVKYEDKALGNESHFPEYVGPTSRCQSTRTLNTSLYTDLHPVLHRKEVLLNSEQRSIKPRIRPKESVTLAMWHPLSPKVGTNFTDSGGRSVGVIRWRTQATEFSKF
jgi:hypothetical protein